MKRNSGHQQSFDGSLSQQRRRQIMLSVRVAQIKKKDLWNETNVKDTGIRTITLLLDDLVCGLWPCLLLCYSLCYLFKTCVELFRLLHLL